MNFNHSDDRQMLADSLGRFFAERYDFETRKRIAVSAQGFSRKVWSELAELGVIGALFDKTVGGFGGDGFDVMVLFEALGRALAVEPFLGTLMAGGLLRDRTDLAPDIIAGRSIVALAHLEPTGRYDLTDIATAAQWHDGHWVLSGRKAVVPQLESADWICVSARSSAGVNVEPAGASEDGISLFLVPARRSGVTVKGYAMIDGGRGGDLILNEVVLEPSARLGIEGSASAAIERAFAAGIVALSAEAVGIMQVVRDATLDYLRSRKQFGVPIGKFQALQHRMTTVLLEIEQAKSATINAAAALGGDRKARERAVAASKYTIGRVGTLVAEEAIQMHGGIGMTWDLPLSHYAKRLVMIGHQLGDEDYHLARYISLDSHAV